MKKNTIEFILMLLILVVTGKGIFTGMMIGLFLFVLKVIYKKLSTSYKLTPPIHSIGTGALAGITSFLLKLIF